MSNYRIAVIVPCYNEELTIAKVVTDFRAAVPGADVYVIDNNSDDRTADEAARAGAIVLHEKRQGKGEVLRGVCGRLDADYFILVDGDDTYPAEAATQLLEPLLRDKADMVVGTRQTAYAGTAPRLFHQSGNGLVCWLVNRIFGSRLTDVMSGYRAFTWRAARALPIISIGFDVETEMTIQLLYRRYVLQEVPVHYRSRPAESHSKLRTFRDGFHVLLKIFVLLVAYKPLTFFGSLAVFSGFASVVLMAYGVAGPASAAGLELQAIWLGAVAMVAAVLFVSLGLTISSVNWRVLELESHLMKLVERRERRSDASGSSRHRFIDSVLPRDTGVSSR